MSEVNRRAQKGAVWTVAGFGTNQVLRVVSNVILTRLLTPDVFGLMQFVNTFLQGLFLFSDIGIRPSIIQNERGDDPKFLNTAWTIQVARGCVLFAASLLLTVPVADFFEQPELRLLLPVAGFQAMVAGFYSSKLASQNRALNLKRITLIDIFGQVVLLGTTVIVAIQLRSVWAFMIGSLTSNVVRLVLSHLALPGERNKLTWDKSAVSTLLRFGRWIFVNTLLTFLISQSDKIVIGKLESLERFGLYAIAASLALTPAGVLNQLNNQIVFPLLSRTRLAGEPLAPVFHQVRGLMIIAAGWVLSGFIAGGPTIIDVLYDGPYLECGWMLQILSVGAFISIVETVNYQALLALGKTGWNLIGRLVMIAGMAVSIGLGWYYYGFPGIIAGYSAAELFRYAVSCVALQYTKLANFKQDLKLFSIVAASSAAGWYAVQLAHKSREYHVPAIDAVIVFVVVSAFWVGPGLPVVKKFLADRRLQRQVPGGTPASGGGSGHSPNT